MSAGFAWEEWNPYQDPDNDNRKMFESGKWLDYALSRPMAQKPFTAFKYNSGCPMIVAALIEKATGMRLEAFAEGAGGQRLCILPEYRLLVAFTERNYSTQGVGRTILRDYILPALR